MPQDLLKSKQNVQTRVNPANLNIRNLKVTNQGNVVVKCDTKQDMERFRKEAEEKLNSKYEIHQPKKISPKIQITGYSGDEPMERLEMKTRNPNNWIDSFN